MKISIWFSDMWGFEQYLFNPSVNFFYASLEAYGFNVSLDKDNPDVLFYSCFGLEHKKYRNSIKIFFTGENIPRANSAIKVHPDYNECHFSLSYLPQSELNYQVPLWVLFVNWFGVTQPLPLPSNPAFLIDENQLSIPPFDRGYRYYAKSRFCAFMNNNLVKDRVKLFLDLEKQHGEVDSYGTLFNSQPGGLPLRGSEQDKLRVYEKHKFVISYENSYRSGYVTEKLIHPYSVGAIPLYKGGVDYSIYNKQAFISRDLFSSDDEYLEYILTVSNSEELFNTTLKEPLFVDGDIPLRFKPTAIVNWLAEKLYFLFS
jgi:hypothetical protein